MNRRARQNKAPRNLGSGKMNPPQIRTNVIVTHKYRFTSSSGTTTAITSDGCAFAAGAIGTVTNSKVNALAASVKLDCLEIWTPPAAQGNTATCSVEWNGQQSSSTVEVSDTTVSTAIPAHVKTTPPARSLSSFWQDLAVGNVQLCAITAPAGSIIDATISFILDDSGNATTQASVGTAVIGEVYYLALDATGTHIYTPVALNTTF